MCRKGVSDGSNPLYQAKEATSRSVTSLKQAGIVDRSETKEWTSAVTVQPTKCRQKWKTQGHKSLES